MDLKLTNKVALVTGGSSGLGFAIARELACEGASVAIVARRKPELDSAAAEILKVARTRVLPLAGDVSKPGEAERIARIAEESLGPIDILLANAGGPPSTTFDSTSDEQYIAAIELNTSPPSVKLRLMPESLSRSRSKYFIRVLPFSVSCGLLGR